MRKFLLMSVALVALAACTTPEQKLYDADVSINVTLARAIKYVSLPTADPAVKETLKAEGTAAGAAEGADQVQAADQALRKTLADNKINCGAAATDTCP